MIIIWHKLGHGNEENEKGKETKDALIEEVTTLKARIEMINGMSDLTMAISFDFMQPFQMILY